MFKTNSIIILFVTLIMIFICPTSQSNDSLEEKLRKELSLFRENNKLPQAQFDKLLFEHTTKKVSIINKGAVGDGLDIALRSDSNKLFINNKPWIGAGKSVVQVVLTDGNSVFTEKEKVDISKLKVVIFTPNHVQVVDFFQNFGVSMPR